MQFPDHPFWDFAIRVYTSEGVSAACLNLQERHGIDVNLMLFCLWLGHSGRGVMSGAEIDAAVSASNEWHHVVVKGLRHVRQTLKSGFPDVDQDLAQALRSEVQKTEINAEHLEQLILVDAVPRDPLRADAPAASRARDAADNLRRYLGTTDVTPGARDGGDIVLILGRAFDGLDADTVREAAGILT